MSQSLEDYVRESARLIVNKRMRDLLEPISNQLNHKALKYIKEKTNFGGQELLAIFAQALYDGHIDKVEENALQAISVYVINKAQNDTICFAPPAGDIKNIINAVAIQPQGLFG